MHFLRRNVKLIAGVSICVLLVSGGGLYAAERSWETIHVTASVALGFEGVNQGLYPNGTFFEPYDLIATPVIETALAEMKAKGKMLDLTLVRSLLDVQGGELPAVPGPRSPENQVTRPLFPSQYQLTIAEGERHGIDVASQKELLSALIDAFRSYYQGRAGTKDISDSLLKPDAILAYDFPFIPGILSMQIDRVRRHVQELEKRARALFASPSGASFRDLLRELEVLQNLNVENIRSLVAENGLTQNRDQALRRYELLIRQSQVSASMKDEQARYAQDFLAQLDRSESTTVGSRDGSNFAEVLIRQDYRTSLLRQALENGMAARRAEADLASYRATYSSLQRGPEPGSQERAISGVRDEVTLVHRQLTQTLADTAQMERQLLADHSGRAVVKVSEPATVMRRKVNLRDVTMLIVSAVLLGLVGLMAFRETVGEWATLSRYLTRKGRTAEVYHA